MTKHIFFSGKGGVGKTTMASATAIHHALTGNKTLIVTTDPASNLADVFEQEIGHKTTPVQGVENLSAMEIDPDEATREYREGIIGPYREIMPEDVIASLEENLSGPCTTEMAAFDRFIDFMEGDEYDVIVFDTAPTGHTIRLLALPVNWSRHIEEASKGSGQTCLGPVRSIEDSKDKYDRATALLKDPGRTTFIFVMRPDELSLYETLRASRELEAIGITAGEIIINAILPKEACRSEFFKRQYASQQGVIKKAEETIRKPTRRMLLRDGEVKGVDALRSIGEELFDGKKPGPRTRVELPVREDFSEDKPDLDHLWLPGKEKTKAIFFTGKGGVGKTTISCIASLYIAQRGFKTLLVTTDPAAHIGEVLDVKVGSEPGRVAGDLHAVMVDQESAFKEYKERVLDEARGRYSEEMLAAMEEELNSPCTEEMAAFDKFVQYIEGRDYDVVVFDTAPTGHTLRLLDLPFGYAKQAETMGSTGEGAAAEEVTRNRFRDIIEILRDKDRALFSLVLYPESTPMLESHRAMVDLKKAGIETRLVVANMVIPENACINDFFKNRRQMQMKYLKDIREKFELPLVVYPLVEDNMRGIERLKRAAAVL